MFSPRVLFFLLFTVISFSVFSQKKEDFKQPRILILLDGSSSMVNEWVSGKKRFNAAGDIILRLMDSIYKVNNNVEFSLRLYGHQHGVNENNCYDTRREVMFSKNNYTQMALRLASLQPLGVSPIAYSLQTAAETDFDNERDYAYSLVLITDGGESCNGNICEVVKNLLDKKIAFKPYIVSLVDYAPLKEQYNCLGNYLTVSKPSEIEPAIHTIAEAYRKVLSIPIAKSKLPETSSLPSPRIQKIKAPQVEVKLPDPDTTGVVKKALKPAPDIQQPAATSATISKIKVDNSFLTKEKIASINRIGLDRINYALFWSTVTPKKRMVPKFSLPPNETQPAATSPAKPTTTISKPASQTSPVKPPKPEAKETSYTIQLEPASETLLEVYFTDGKGKFYTSTPPMKLLDAVTGAEVKKFYRTIDANGNPDPQKVAPGNYVLLMGKTGNYKTKTISIQAAKKNKVIVVVNKGTLHFRYDDNPKRPVKEYMALVRKTFQAGTSVIQKCTEEREYEPGNYHIEINTMPMMIRNIDLEFGWSYTIDIPEPGFVQFTNTNPVGRITLWTPLGDQFAHFHAMDLNGNPEMQNLRLLPGVYEVHWKRNPAHPNEPEVIQKFFVKSNQTTEVLLQ